MLLTYRWLIDVCMRVTRFGEGKWSAISGMVLGRNDAACKRRWHAFPAELALQLSAAYSAEIETEVCFGFVCLIVMVMHAHD